MNSQKRPLYESDLKGLKLLNRGKVRDIYEVDPDHLLIVATDRLSAFDYVLPQPIPGKGEVLTRLSKFWFDYIRGVIPNHLVEDNDLLAKVIPDPHQRDQLRNRMVLVRRLKPLPIEAIVRGYLIGSGWKDYERTGAVCGIQLQEGLQLADKLPETIFTPSTKAAQGDHDENISLMQASDRLAQFLVREFGFSQDKNSEVWAKAREIAEEVRDLSLQIYIKAATYARKKGIIIADTKLEFGLSSLDELVLIDEVLTPDSSRFWPEEHYRPGSSPPSFDKQYVRDYLEAQKWDKKPPIPDLPQEVIDRTAEMYREAEWRLSGK